MLKTLKGRDVLSSYHFSLEELKLVINTSEKFEERIKGGEIIKILDGKVVACLFFEPSTRTRLCFESAAHRLGAEVISVTDPMSSSIAKGETMVDTIKTVDGYSDFIVIRHPMKGAAQIAAENAEHPVLNAGDGIGEHPTEAFIDMYTILKEKGSLGGHTVTLLGDLKYGRTVHSLAYFLFISGNKTIFVSPKSLKMPQELTGDLKKRGAAIEETEDINAALAKSDIVYVTRVQRERFENKQEYDKIKGSYIINMSVIKHAKKGITVMHPLPRVDELTTDVDKYEGAAYFRQAHRGVFVRMALLSLIHGKE